MIKTKLVAHPVVVDSIAYLRDKNTDLARFRHYSDKVCQALFFEAMRELDTQEVDLQTPITWTKGQKLNAEIVVVPVLRAGLAMLFGALRMLPQIKVGFVGMARDEETAEANQYYWKLPNINQETTVVITDPMLATGGSLLHLLRQIKPLKPKKIKIVVVIAAPEGIAAIEAEFPEVEIYVAAVDEKLNEKKYIVPGLGDYGDRYFGT